MEEAQISALVDEVVDVLPPERRPEDLEALLCGYLSHLIERNREINLVSRRDTLLHVRRFVHECLFLARVLCDQRDQRDQRDGPPMAAGPLRLLDIGSGGGFPGLVLKIAIPDVDIVLVEATRKKARFLADVAAGLDLRHARVLWARAEDLVRVEAQTGSRDLTRGFDWVTCKALGTIQSSSALAEPFLRPGGVHWTFKGAGSAGELEAAGGLFRQRGLATRLVERIPGDVESYVVGVERLAPGSGGRSAPGGRSDSGKSSP